MVRRRGGGVGRLVHGRAGRHRPAGPQRCREVDRPPAAVRAHPPVVGLESDGTDAPPLSGTRGQFRTNIRTHPPVIGLEYLKLRLQIQVLPTSDAHALALAIQRVIEIASDMDRTFGGEGLSKFSQESEVGTVVVVLGSVDPIGGDERISKIVAAMNQRREAEEGATILTAEAA